MTSLAPAPWTQGVIYSFDVESTSPDPMTAHIVTASLVKLFKGEYSDKRSWALRPAVEIPQAAIDVHGITNEWIQENGADPAEGLEGIITMLVAILKGRFPLVVCNAAYDLTVIEAQAEYYGVRSLREQLTKNEWRTIIDPMVLAKGYEHYWLQEFVKGRNFKLPSVCERYGVPFVESHDATADAIGAGRLAVELVNRDAVMSTKGPAGLTQLQKTWRLKSQNGLRAYFEKKNMAFDDVDSGWPLHSSLITAG